MAKLRINGDSSGYVDLEAPNAASSSTLDLDQVPQKNATTTAFTGSHVIIGDTTTGNAHANADDLVIGNTSSNKRTGLTIVTANDQDGSIMWSDGTSSGNANIQGQLVYNHPDNSMRFYTAVSEGMRISGDGHVTKPKQPAFDAARPEASSASTNLTGWQNTYVNKGNHFNASTGKFTAPVTGTYIFYATGIKSSTTTTTMRYYLVKNSSAGWVSDQRHLRLDGGNINTYGDNGIIQWMVDLAQNDWVQAKISGGTVYTSTAEYTIFGGYLLS